MRCATSGIPFYYFYHHMCGFGAWGDKAVVGVRRSVDIRAGQQGWSEQNMVPMKDAITNENRILYAVLISKVPDGCGVPSYFFVSLLWVVKRCINCMGSAGTITPTKTLEG